MKKSLLLLSIIAFLGSCSNPKKEVEAAMKEYDQLILRVDADAIAETFVKNGEMGEMGKLKVVGKDSIRKFLQSFSHIQVASNESTISSTEITGDSAFQKGTFKQTAIVNGDTVHASGELFSTWVKIDNRWKLKRMFTKSK